MLVELEGLYGVVLINFEEIEAVEQRKNYTVITMKTGKDIKVLEPASEVKLEIEKLLENMFAGEE